MFCNYQKHGKLLMQDDFLYQESFTLVSDSFFFALKQNCLSIPFNENNLKLFCRFLLSMSV